MINIKENLELNTLNHSCAHLMAQAIKHLYPHAKFWVGPVIDDGFYYDMDIGEDVIKEEDFPKIEKEMKKISKDGKKIVRIELSKKEALEMFKDDENFNIPIYDKKEVVSDEEASKRAILKAKFIYTSKKELYNKGHVEDGNHIPLMFL